MIPPHDCLSHYLSEHNFPDQGMQPERASEREREKEEKNE